MYCVVLCRVWFAPSFSKTTRVDTSGQSQVAEECMLTSVAKSCNCKYMFKYKLKVQLS